MSRKIIILNGSPRKSGNTAALTAQLKKGAEEYLENLIRVCCRTQQALFSIYVKTAAATYRSPPL